jgi:hypothetical protein
MKIRNSIKILIVLCLYIQQNLVNAKESLAPVFEIRFVQHHFTPRSLIVPAGRPAVLKVVNSSAETIEFESFRLNREKIVEAGKTVTLILSPLKAGRYDFFDDFHPDVPEGEIVAQ